MTSTAKYFRDRMIMLLFSTNVFLALAASLFVVLRLSSINTASPIVQYRRNLGIDAYHLGTRTQLLNLALFALITTTISLALSLRTYKINRYLSLTVLSISTLLLLLTFIVSDQLLVR